MALVFWWDLRTRYLRCRTSVHVLTVLASLEWTDNGDQECAHLHVSSLCHKWGICTPVAASMFPNSMSFEHTRFFCNFFVYFMSLIPSREGKASRAERYKKRFVCMQIIFVFPFKCHARTLLPLSFRSLPIHLKKPRARKVDLFPLFAFPKCFRKKRIPERRTVSAFSPPSLHSFKKTKQGRLCAHHP